MILAIVSAVLSKSVGTSGGEIRHTEIRANASLGVDTTQSENEKEGDEN